MLLFLSTVVVHAKKKPRSTKLDQGRPWSTLADQGRPRSTVVDLGRQRSAFSVLVFLAVRLRMVARSFLATRTVTSPTTSLETSTSASRLVRSFLELMRSCQRLNPIHIDGFVASKGGLSIKGKLGIRLALRQGAAWF